MKYIANLFSGFLILGFIVFSTASSYAQSKNVIDKHFSDLVKDKRYTSVSVNPKIFNKLSSDPESKLDDDVKELITQLHGLHILSSEENGGLERFESAKTKMASTKYEELLFVQESEQDRTIFYIDEKSNAIKELIMIQGKPNNFSITTFLGDDIDLKSLIKLSQSLDVDGMDQLKKLNEK